MINEIAPHRFNNHYLTNECLSDNAFILHYQKNTMLWKVNGNKVELPLKSDLTTIVTQAETVFLFTLNDTACFLYTGKMDDEMPGFEYKDISFFRTNARQELAWVSIAGYQLKNWYEQNRFCGKCGSKNQHKADERAMICSSCSLVVYPKISPAIIVAIICNDKILLARNSNFPSAWYSLIAGYADVGESLEECVNREVKEEVGLDVRNIRYYKSHPWPLSGSLMIGFTAEADENQPICIDQNEIAEAAWFTRDNLPNHPPVLSISGEMIALFAKGELI
jgi:NAD+ diphosphatase